ncbi:MAG TPA: ROK family transcriptional regulator [Kofleriaceae bacterium]|nr:ROK family transcriptional regulator [Kofleriaceae bacterium]
MTSSIGGRSGRRRDLRWRGALDALAAVRRAPGITRAALARQVGLSSSSATEITARLRELALLRETPAPVTGRGRPTTLLGAHPRGPLVLAVDLRHEDWRLALAGVDGRIEHAGAGRHRRRDPRSVLDALGAAIAALRGRHRGRVRVVSVAVAGTVQEQRLMQASTLGWGEVDLRPLLRGAGLPLLVGNDATLAGVAEARGGAGAHARAVLHLIVEVGIGGILVVDGRPVTGATGAGGEFGHVPLGGGGARLRCPCGARGCWDVQVDGRALARHLGQRAPANARTYARAVLDRAGSDRAARRAADACAAALGSGTAALVNALDPDVVTLGGLAVPLHARSLQAFRRAYAAGLMTFRRTRPPEVRHAAHGEDGPLQGAAEVGLDAILTEAGLAAWAARRA